MTKYFREKTTGPEEVYRAGKFVSRIFELIPDAKIISEGVGRYNNDDKGYRVIVLYVPGGINSREAFIHIKERVFSLPKKSSKGKDDWGKEPRAHTRIEIREVSISDEGISLEHFLEMNL